MRNKENEYGLKIFIDSALRKSGVVICDKNWNILDKFVVTYGGNFDSLDFSTIYTHKMNIKNVFKKISSTFGKKVDFIGIEADVFGNRKGGYKMKELMTAVRLNFAYSAHEVLKVNTKNIKFVTAGKWKSMLFKTSGLKKKEYREKLLEIIKNELNFDASKIKSPDILDAFGILLFFKLNNH